MHQTHLSMHTVIKFLLAMAALQAAMAAAASGVVVDVQDEQVVVDNGVVQLSLSKPEGQVTGVRHNGGPNLLEFIRKQPTSGGYWDAVWNYAGSQQRGYFDSLDGTEFKVITSNEEQVEISFRRTWNASQGNRIRLNVDKRFAVLNGSSGFYSYAIFEHPREWPSLSIAEARLVFKLREDLFHYMAISDELQREMPSAADRRSPRGVPLAYKEAVLLKNPIEPQFKGEVDDKYSYTLDNKDNRVHGWISSGTNGSTGFWVISPSNEFKCGGPLKRELTSHVGPTSLTMFLGTHYVGKDIVVKVEEGEYWKKVFGPVFMYMNSSPKQGDAQTLWDGAKAQAQTEVSKWPYSCPASENFEKADQRGSVTGRLWVRDSYISKNDTAADMAYVGLASPGEPNSWSTESKGYQFWTRTNSSGYFTIDNVRTGEYNLYGWVPGFLGDYKSSSNLTITPGSSIKLGDLIFEPPRSGPTLWEIGVPDRSAAEFFVPDPNPEYANRLLSNYSTEKYRQYGLWERYTDLYPQKDLVYTVGISNYSKDWFFAHVTRKVENSTIPATWQIKFPLDNVQTDEIYTLRVAIAAAQMSRLQVRVNNAGRDGQFTTQGFGEGNVIARHGIRGIEWTFDFAVPGRLLLDGENTIYLTQARGGNPFFGLMYDYVRFEGPTVRATRLRVGTEIARRSGGL